jgi:hypothetical protein
MGWCAGSGDLPQRPAWRDGKDDGFESRLLLDKSERDIHIIIGLFPQIAQVSTDCNYETHRTRNEECLARRCGVLFSCVYRWERYSISYSYYLGFEDLFLVHGGNR